MHRQQTKVKMDFEQIFIFLYCLFLTLRLNGAEECVQVAGDNCSCTTSKGIVDFHKLTELSIKSGDYTYDFQPCRGLSKICGTEAGNTVAVCQRSSLGNSFDAGNLNTVQFSGDPATNTLLLTYTADDRTSKVTAICDWSVEGQLTRVVESPKNTYNINLNTKYSCFGSPPRSSNKISTGSVLLIIFFLFIGIYFIAGILFLKFARGAQGTEMIPNYGFWMSLPGYIKDGVMFTFRGCKTESSYSQI